MTALRFFSPAALSDKCKCSCSLEELEGISLLPFVYLSPLSLHAPPLPSQTPSRMNFIIAACSFFHPDPPLSFREVNKSDSGGCWNDRISLSAGSLVTLQSPPPPAHIFEPFHTAAAAASYIILDIISILELQKKTFISSPHTRYREISLRALVADPVPSVRKVQELIWLQ